MKEMSVMLEAQARLCSVRPGVPCAEIDWAANGFYAGSVGVYSASNRAWIWPQYEGPCGERLTC
jgi:hypothetical protein